MSNTRGRRQPSAPLNSPFWVSSLVGGARIGGALGLWSLSGLWGLHHARESGNIPGGALVPLPVGLRWPFSNWSKHVVAL